MLTRMPNADDGAQVTTIRPNCSPPTMATEIIVNSVLTPSLRRDLLDLWVLTRADTSD